MNLNHGNTVRATRQVLEARNIHRRVDDLTDGDGGRAWACSCGANGRWVFRPSVERLHRQYGNHASRARNEATT